MNLPGQAAQKIEKSKSDANDRQYTTKGNMLFCFLNFKKNANQ
jgi:hypothetical protein